MKFLLFHIILITLSPFPSHDSARYRVLKNSTVVIEGSTNVNNFNCESYYTGQDILIEKWNSKEGVALLTGEIHVNIAGFECHNKLITRDFRETLKMDEFPEIKIQFLSLSEDQRFKTRKATGMVEITLAETSKKYFIICDLSTSRNGNTILHGKQLIRFSDFGLNPPKKMMGMIKVENEVKVGFNLELKQIK